MRLRDKLSDKPTETIEGLRHRIWKLEVENAQLHIDNNAMAAELVGNIPEATHWLQLKVWRQRVALDVLNRKVLSQRFVLREVERLGRGLTRYEYELARARIENDQLRERIEDPE